MLTKGRRSKTAILQIPFDILILIVDKLALHDKFLLSHTCKAFRSITFQHWDNKISRLSLHDKIKFWDGLAYTLPSHWVCPQCCQLHRINTWDSPSMHRIIREVYQIVPCNVDLSRRIGRETYSIHHYHIQLALKLSRLGNTQHKYLAALMVPFIDKRLSIRLGPLRDSYAAEPRIVNGQFTLREEGTICNETSADLLFPENRSFHLPVCPHLGLKNSNIEYSRADKRRIINEKLHQSHNACMRRRNESDWLVEFLLKEFTLIEDGLSSALRCPG